MTTLYSCRHAGDEWRITKFDSDLNVESSYLCTHDACQCPQGERGKTCRHQQMLPKFIQRGAIDSNWLYDFERDGWVQMNIMGEYERDEDLPGLVSAANSSEAETFPPAEAFSDDSNGPLPQGPFTIRRRG